MKPALLVLTLAVLLGACSGQTPLNPSGNKTANLHVSVDGASCAGLGPVKISIDGTFVGTVSPGDGGVTKEVGLGQHVISGVSVNYPSYGWAASDPKNSVTVGAGGWTAVLPCS